MLTIEEILTKNPPKILKDKDSAYVVGIDPGNTTGVIILRLQRDTLNNIVIDIKEELQIPIIEEKPVLKISWGQLEVLLELGIKPLNTKNSAIQVVMEDYRVYAHKLDRHTFSKVPTLRLIGAIDFACYLKELDLHYQMAQQAKQFITDEKLQFWGFFKKTRRHSRDALRHILYWLIVTNRSK